MLNCIIGVDEKLLLCISAGCGKRTANTFNVFFVKAATPRPPSTVRAFAYSANAIFLFIYLYAFYAQTDTQKEIESAT